jgi:RimJ/RimL family protein N-acetyltransferase
VTTLHTARLTLRPHATTDLDDCLALWTDPVVTRFTSGRPSTREETWGRILRYAGHWSLHGYGFWVAEETVTGRYAGEVGMMDFKRGVDEPTFGRSPEAGWVLAPWAHGKGFATEAVQAALAWYEQRFGASRTVCMIQDGNDASVRVAAKCGYREYAKVTYQSHPLTLFERAAPLGCGKTVAGRSLGQEGER